MRDKSERRRISPRGDDLLFIRDDSPTGPRTYRSRVNGIIQRVTVQHIEKKLDGRFLGCR